MKYASMPMWLAQLGNAVMAVIVGAILLGLLVAAIAAAVAPMVR
jgi:hypothetical protein